MSRSSPPSCPSQPPLNFRRKQRENEARLAEEAEARSRQSTKRLEGYAYFDGSLEDFNQVATDFCILADRGWVAVDWDDQEMTPVSADAPIESFLVGVHPVDGSASLINPLLPRNPLNIETLELDAQASAKHFGVCLAQISLRKEGPLDVGYLQNQKASRLDTMSRLLKIWDKEETDSQLIYVDPPYLLFQPGHDRDSIWPTIDIDEIIPFHHENLERCIGPGRKSKNADVNPAFIPDQWTNQRENLSQCFVPAELRKCMVNKRTIFNNYPLDKLGKGNFRTGEWDPVMPAVPQEASVGDLIWQRTSWSWFEE